MRLAKTIVLVGAVTSLGICGDLPKTLPPAMYESMKSGKKLNKVFVDPAYIRQTGFKVAPIQIKGENRSVVAFDALTKALTLVSSSDSPNSLQVTIVEVTAKYPTGFGNVMGHIAVEGKVVSPDGKVLAAFVTSERAGTFGAEMDDYPAACDKIMSAIAKDLL